MARVSCDITMSLDGFIAGPSPSLDKPLGEGGDRLHEWVYGLETWRRLHGLSGGSTNADADVLEEAMDGVGASVMGRRMFSGGAGPWDEDARADGWWGDDPPFHTPVFVVTHHPRETTRQGGRDVVRLRHRRGRCRARAGSRGRRRQGRRRRGRCERPPATPRRRPRRRAPGPRRPALPRRRNAPLRRPRPRRGRPGVHKSDPVAVGNSPQVSRREVTDS